ncbi:MAG: ATP-binding protein [Candidatus Tectimicrobiota bacterium]
MNQGQSPEEPGEPSQSQQRLADTPLQAWQGMGLDVVAEPAYIVDTAGCITWGNAAFAQLLGYSLAEVQGQPSTRYYVPDAAALFATRRRLVQQGEGVAPSLHTTLLCRDGRQVPVMLCVSTLAQDGYLLGRLGVLQRVAALPQAPAQPLTETATHTEAPGDVQGPAAAAPWDQAGEPAALAASWSPVVVGCVALCLMMGAVLLGLRLQTDRIAIFWPAAGVSAGLVLVTRERRRWAAVLGVLAALSIGNALSRRGIATSLVFMGGNLAQACLLAALLEWCCGSPLRCNTLRCVSMLLLLTVLVVACTGLLPAAGLRATGHASGTFWQVWYIWCTSHATGILTVMPALIALGHPGAFLPLSPPPIRTGMLMLALLGGVATVLMALPPGDHQVTLILTTAVLYSLLMGIAMWCAPGWSAGAVVMIAVIVVWLTVHQVGLFATTVTAAQVFLGLTAMWSLTLAALFEQQRCATAAIRSGAEQLRRSEERLQLALQAGRMGMWEWDLGTDELRTDAFYRHLWDLEGAEPVVPTALVLRRVHPDDLPRAWTAARRDDLPERLDLEFRILCRNGAVRWLRGVGLSLREASGVVSRVIGVNFDITDQKQTEATLRDLNTMLEQRVQARTAALEEAIAERQHLERAAQRAEHFAMLGRLAAGVSHELRNPLAVVFLHIELLEEELRQPSEDPAVLAETMREIKTCLARVDDLMQDYLSLVRVHSIQRDVQDLGLAVQAWSGDFRQIITAHDGECHLEGVETLGQVAFHASTLRRALLNLIQNAAEALHPGGRVTLAGQRTGTQVQLQVRDTGSGIAAERLAHIFEPLQTTKPGGTGLGLYIVQEVVTAHGGEVTVQSVAGQGTTFTITLPLSAPLSATGHAMSSLEAQ